MLHGTVVALHGEVFARELGGQSGAVRKLNSELVGGFRIDFFGWVLQGAQSGQQSAT